MKILFNNPYLNYDNKNSLNVTKKTQNNKSNISNFKEINFGNLSAGAKFLLTQTSFLNCAYSGKPLISQKDAKNVYHGLARYNTTLNTTRYLKKWYNYMHDVEQEVFNLLMNSEKQSETNFQDVLLQYSEKSEKKVSLKQLNILSSVNKLIGNLSPNTAISVKKIYNKLMNNYQNKILTRENALEFIKTVKGKKKDNNTLEQITNTLALLPDTYTDLDLFIVEYSKHNHYEIAKRLISPSVATIEHVIPASKGGPNSLFNFLLVSQFCNRERGSNALDEYIISKKNIDIVKNIKNYINKIVLDIIFNQRSGFKKKIHSIDKLCEVIEQETKSKVAFTQQEFQELVDKHIRTQKKKHQKKREAPHYH